MNERKPADKLSIEELEQLLYLKKHSRRRERLQRLKNAGRVVEVAGLPPPNPMPPPLPFARTAMPTGALRRYALDVESQPAVEEEKEARPGIQWRWVANKFLLLIEVMAVAGFVLVLLGQWLTQRELDRELAAVQEAEVAEVALPTTTPPPVIEVVVLPSGHKPPVDGRSPEAGEAGNIPAHLLPVINAYVAPPIPTPGPEQARRLQIPAIGVDKPIVQGDDWEQLKKGVGQHLNGMLPGRVGNLVLSAHNDIFGSIFRDLDKLLPGDEVIVSTERSSYTYVVREIQVVEPTDVWVLAPTEHASLTLISCYPYLIDNKRIVVFADLVEEGVSGN